MMLVLCNVRMISSNMRKNKRITECDKNTVTCHVDTAQYEADTIKCEKKKNKRTTECDKSIVTYDVGIA